MGVSLRGVCRRSFTPIGVWLPFEDHPNRERSVLSRKASIYFHHLHIALDL